MTTAAPSTALVTIQPVFTDAERLALAGFLAGYRGLTREAYALDLRQFTNWCRTRSLNLFAVRRSDIEGFARELEARGRARATVTRRLCTIAGFYKYAVEEELLEHSPAAHVRRPRVDYESHAVALDRNELGALLVTAGLGPPTEHALISLLALNGLRVSEATGADIEHLGLERGHRTLTITRKGGKVVTILLAPRTARAIDLAIGERTGGPVFLAADGRRLDRHGAGRIVRKAARRAISGKAVTPHTLRHAFITAALDAGQAVLQDGHGDLGQIVQYEKVDGALLDEMDGGFEPVAPEALAVCDANHKVSSASATARGRCSVTSSASERTSRVSSGSIRASQWPRAAPYFASSQRS